MPERREKLSLTDEIQKFKVEFEKLFPSDPKLLYTSPIYLAVKIKLIRSELDSEFSPIDILSEVLLRGVQSIKKGKSIKNTGGWVYKVCHYVVVEHIRKKSNTATFTSNGNSSLDKVPALSESSEDLNFNNVRLDQYNKVKKALKKLNPRSREILEFVEIDKWSYEEIAEYLTKKYGEYRTVQALRKQKSRALKQLKTIYEQLT